MVFVLRRLQAGDEALFHDIAPEVFDEPIHAGRMYDYLRTPGHMLVLA